MTLDRRHFHDRDNGNTIEVEIEDSAERFRWRMAVNGVWSDWSQHYQGILAHAGYNLATAYWGGVFPEFVPFKAVSTTED